MNEVFFTKLHQVFVLITEQPDGIVDDTALDRLLVSLENISKHQLDEQIPLIEIVLTFMNNVESWKHTITASFGLRCVDFIKICFMQVYTVSEHRQETSSMAFLVFHPF